MTWKSDVEKILFTINKSDAITKKIPKKKKEWKTKQKTKNDFQATGLTMFLKLGSILADFVLCESLWKDTFRSTVLNMLISFNLSATSGPTNSLSLQQSLKEENSKISFSAWLFRDMVIDLRLALLTFKGMSYF